jgi:hypothetical protein
MGSYNYEALHKNTPVGKRAWVPDPFTANRGYMNGNVRAVDQPYINGYGNNALMQDRLLLAQAAQAQAQMFGGGVSQYGGLPKYNLPNEPLVGLIPPDQPLVEVAEMDRYANGRRPFFQPRIRERRRERRAPRRERRKPRGERVEPVVGDQPVRELSTSQSPAQSPAPVPAAAAAEEQPLAGMIFGCTSDTYMECMQLKLFALPAANKSEVNGIQIFF